MAPRMVAVCFVSEIPMRDRLLSGSRDGSASPARPGVKHVTVFPGLAARLPAGGLDPVKAAAAGLALGRDVVALLVALLFTKF